MALSVYPNVHLHESRFYTLAHVQTHLYVNFNQIIINTVPISAYYIWIVSLLSHVLFFNSLTFFLMVSNGVMSIFLGIECEILSL